MEGFTQDELAMHAPSVTNRLGTSCAWLWALSTDVLGSLPMRAVPISCTLNPGGPSWSYVSMFLQPAASSISADWVFTSSLVARSLSLQAQCTRNKVSRHASVRCGSRSTLFVWRGRHSSCLCFVMFHTHSS